MGTASSQPIKQPMLPPVGMVEPDKVSRSTNDHYQILAHLECDAPARFQTEVEKLKEQFHSLDKEVRAAGKLVVRGIAQMIPALAKMEPFLSRKGEHHEPHYVKMLVAAGLPTWEDYKKQVAADFEISVRTVQRKLAEHRGEPKEIQPRRLSSGSPSVTRKARPDPVQNAAVATAARLLAEAKEQFGKAADGGSEQAKAVIAQYEEEYAEAVARSVTPVSAPVEVPALSPSLQPQLMKLTPPLVTDGDPDDVLVVAAHTAGVNAANAATEILTTYRPRLVLTARPHSFRFRRALGKKGFNRFTGEHIDLSKSAPVFNNYDQAWDYAQAFWSALSKSDISDGFDIEAGVDSRPNGAGYW